jgi:hypothetical protein
MNLTKTLFEKKYNKKINDNSRLTKKEKESVKSLIELGDNVRLAILTIKETRNRYKNAEFYRFAYEG